MSRKTLQLGFCLCLVALAAFSTVPVQAAEAPFLGTTKSGVGSTMDKACAQAIQNLKNYCGIIAPPTTNPGGCSPLYGLDGQVIGQVCRCEATTLSCLNH
jgi:hypothetical protein